MKITILPGLTIYKASDLAVRKAQELNDAVTFEFNQIELNVSPLSWPNDIVMIYHLKCQIRRLETK